MRFITEFELTENTYATQFPKKKVIEYRKQCRENEMGNMISESFGWVNPNPSNLDHYRLEIEAFPMDKWIEFKEKLFKFIYDYERDNACISGDALLLMFKELESFGKPAGEAKELH